MKKRHTTFIDRTGETHITNEGYEGVITECFGNKNCTFEFKSGYILRGIRYDIIKNGKIKNPYHKSVFGVGYMGEGDYISSINNIITKSYAIWRGVIARGYDKKFKDRYSTYKDVTVCEEWHNFQNFAEWFEENWKPWMNSKWHIDKDILIKGNKTYSSENCCFVPRHLNLLFTKNDSSRGEFLIGVYYDNKNKKFIASIRINSKTIYIGSFDTPEEAFQAYKTTKEEEIKRAADEWKLYIELRAYEAMYNYKVEITD